MSLSCLSMCHFLIGPRVVLLFIHVSYAYWSTSQFCSLARIFFLLVHLSLLQGVHISIDEINSRILSLVPGNEKVYLSSDTLVESSKENGNLDLLYPVEFSNSLQFKGIPHHKLMLKVGSPVMLLRNLNQSAGLCNGTRLIITQLGARVLEAQIITRSHIGDKVLLPRIALHVSSTKWPFVLSRRQFLVRLCYAMTINKSQGQTLQNVGLYLPRLVFSHGQLYVAISRVTSRKGLRILIDDDTDPNTNATQNIVYKEILRSLW